MSGACGGCVVVLDRYGRRYCYTVSAKSRAIGCIVMGYAFKIPEFVGYLGGTFLFVPSYQLAAFPKYSSLIVATARL